jgi:hypothetical protein
MSLCPVCGRVYCDHTPTQRGQSNEEMMRPFSDEELEAWRTQPSDSVVKIAAGRKHAHDPIPGAARPQ